MIQAQNISAKIGANQVLQEISLHVREGELFTVIGANGAGKTSFFNLLSGLREATTGTIYLGEKEITNLKPHQRAQAGIARTFQTSSIFPFLTKSWAV